MAEVKTKEGKKFTEEELKKIQEIKKAYNDLTIKLGQLQMEKNHLNEQSNRLDEEYKLLRKDEVGYVRQLSEKYGVGQLDLETGVFIPAE